MKWVGIGLAAIIAGFVLYKISYPTHTYRYRMTVNVEVDGQTRSGSSVIEVKVAEQPAIIINPVQNGAEGEAVFVDLGGQRSLVALLASGGYATDVNFPIVVVPQQFRSELKGQLALLPSLRGRRDLAGKNLPTLVTFSDPNDSTTLRVIRPDHIEQAFGSNVRSGGVVIEMTTDPVTRSLEARLPFLVSQRNTLRNDSIRDSNKFTPTLDVFLRSY
jgi:hypothetical protein